MPITQRELHQQLATEMRANHARVAELARPLDPERLVRKPGARAWSVGETLEHLVLMHELYLPVVLGQIRAARVDAAAPARPWRASFIGRMIASALEKPRRIPTPRIGRPLTPRGGVVEHFLTEDARFIAALDDAAALDWSALRFTSPVAAWLPLKMNLGDAFRIHAVHVKRHIGQIERIIAAVG